MDSLKPEIEHPYTVRSGANLKKEGIFLILEIEAEDTVALRALLNAHIRLINSMLNVLDVLRVL